MLFAQDAAEIAIVAQELHNACCNMGFLYVTGHGGLTSPLTLGPMWPSRWPRLSPPIFAGVPEELCSGILEEAKQWFCLPVRCCRCHALRPAPCPRRCLDHSCVVSWTHAQVTVR